MRVVPLGDKVVIKRLESDEKTSGGIVLPDSARDKPQQGRVLSLGDGRMLPDGQRVPHQIRKGTGLFSASTRGRRWSWTRRRSSS